MEKKKSIILSVLFVLFGCFCYYLATKFLVTKDPGRLGPDFWPKMLCILIIVFSVADIVITLMKKETRNSTEKVRDAVEASPKQMYPLLLMGGIASTAVYIYLQPIIGFSIATALYLASIMILGRYRNKLVIISCSFLGSFILLIIFSKIVYISLPTGIGVLGEFTFLLYKLLGVS